MKIHAVILIHISEKPMQIANLQILGLSFMDGKIKILKALDAKIYTVTAFGLPI